VELVYDNIAVSDIACLNIERGDNLMQFVLIKGYLKRVSKLQKSEGKVLFSSLDKIVAYRNVATSKIGLLQYCDKPNSAYINIAIRQEDPKKH